MEVVIKYPYLFQTCGFPEIDDIRAELESQRDWDHVSSESDSRHVQAIAAQKFMSPIPFSKEQKALRDYLVAKRAGLNISTYAWGLYASVTSPQRQYA